LANLNHEITGVRSLMYPLGDVPVYMTFAEKAKVASLRKMSDVAKTYLSQSGDRALQVTRFDVIQIHDPFSEEAEGVLEQLKNFTTALAQNPQSDWYQATFDFIGTTSGTRDLKVIITSDEQLIQVLVVIAVFGVILTILRRPLICLYLMFTVVFSYLATIGATEAVFELWYEWRGLPFTGLDWKVPIFLFVILVAVGEDYNIYLATRVFEEERRWGRIQGLRAAIIKTGGIITSCGVIMAGTFVSLMSGSLVAMLALGFALTLGVILDTFIVRPVLVPAFLAWLYRVMPERSKETAEDAAPLEEEVAPLGALIGEPMTMPAAPHTEMARRTVNR
jgi:RND superfamily putative drug exporter